MDHEEARLRLAREVLGEDGILMLVRGAADIPARRLNRLLEALDALIEHAGSSLTLDRETAALVWSLGFHFHVQAISWNDQEVLRIALLLSEKIEAFFAIERMEERTLERYRGRM
jgi:hypothetical protein